MIRIVVSPLAEADLDLMYEQDEDSADAAAEIETALDEISNDPSLFERLHQKDFRSIGTPHFDVDRFEELWQQGLNMLRLKFWDWQGRVVPYRVLYAHDARNDIFHILAVARRDHAYDTSHPLVIRVRTQYDSLGIRTY
jgi:hypothetical protein